MTHTFNNCVVQGVDTESRVLAALPPKKRVGSEYIAYRADVSLATAQIYLGRLIDKDLVRRTRWGKHIVYSRVIKPKRRKSSLSYAGTVRIGRGLANW